MLEDLGWNPVFEAAFKCYAKKGWVPSLVVQDNKISYTVYSERLCYCEAILSGRVWHDAETDADLPSVGDWVALEPPANSQTDEPGVIRARLPRRSCFSRKVPGKSAQRQVIAANTDTIMLVTEPVVDLNPRRIERYLLLASRSGSEAVIVVNKAELLSGEERNQVISQLRRTAADVAVHLVSALTGLGLEALSRYFRRGSVVGLVGSSGVGKSTLINALTGEALQWTNEVSEVTGKGRHTTARRTVIFLPGGGVVIDNPGMRELQVWTDDESLRQSFEDVERLAEQCRFRDCKHGNDRGCRVRAALEAGELDEQRYRNYLNLESEIEALKLRQRKRQMTLERKTKRQIRHRHRNYEDREDYKATFVDPNRLEEER